MRLFFCILCAVLLSACATKPGMSPEQILMERVENYWQALRMKDLETAYTMESAAEPRGSMSAFYYAQYIQNRVNIRLIKVKQVSIKGKQGTALMDIAVRLPMKFLPTTIKKELREPWVQIGGVWYHKTSPQKSKRIGEMLKNLRIPGKSAPKGGVQ